MADAASKNRGPFASHLSTSIEQRLQKLVKSLKDSRHACTVESVHELRVASRRLRAFGVTFREVLGDKTRARLEKKLKRVTRAAAGSCR
jgi:CHAD domain-containing protein